MPSSTVRKAGSTGSQENIQAIDGHTAPAHQLGRRPMPAKTRACLLQAFPTLLCSGRSGCMTCPEELVQSQPTSVVVTTCRIMMHHAHKNQGRKHSSVVLVLSPAHRNMLKLVSDFPNLSIQAEKEKLGFHATHPSFRRFYFDFSTCSEALITRSRSNAVL